MRITRRTLLLGAGMGAVTVLLASCTPEPQPTASPSTTPSAVPTPAPTAPTVGSVPAPTAFRRSAWATDAFAHGATSVTPVGVQTEVRAVLAAPVAERLFFAGEATDAEAPGTLRGAVASGERAAAELRAAAGDGERIAIIGAGLAGMAAVERLRTAGLDITVFEARDRIGGRVHTVTDEDWPLPVQLGGWLLGSDDASLQAQWEANGLRTEALTPVAWIDEAGVALEVTEPELPLLAAGAEAAKDLPTDVSLADALAASGANLEDPVTLARLAAFAARSGASIADASAWFPPASVTGESVGVFGDFAAIVQAGIGDVQISLSSAVTHIAHDDAGLSLRLGTGEALSFDRALITVPVGVLQSGAIAFDPPLPFAQRGAIADLVMGQIECVWLRYDEAFWQSDAAVWHLTGADTIIRTWLNLQPVTGDTVLVGIIGGADAVAFAALDDDGVLTAALASLACFVEPDSPS